MFKHSLPTRAVAAATIMVVAGISLAGCGAKRSTEALCQSVATHQATYDSQRKAKEEQGLSGYLAIGASLESIKTMWSDFAKVAPDEIKGDVKDVSDAWDKMEEDALSEQWLKTLTSEMSNSSALDTVDSFIASNCSK